MFARMYIRTLVLLSDAQGDEDHDREFISSTDSVKRERETKLLWQPTINAFRPVQRGQRGIGYSAKLPDYICFNLSGIPPTVPA
ncbi:hypothetical protein KP509_33G031800 [Ceratopteris richardii]|uniref:Uncharacterized protein n=1 Tax=Ceratopteris richardii TaxID=49495 RepID=A0A8T2QPV0_CERRI|nr:hypothetical protein KP509_33G031800 [Ceratopteris richardii]